MAQGNTIWRKVSCSQITSANCSRVLLRWLKRKARQWSCWSCQGSTRSTRWSRPRRGSSPRTTCYRTLRPNDFVELARQIGQAWERLPEPRHPFSLEIITPDLSIFVNLGPHRPRLWPEDLDLLHKMWLELTDEYTGSKLHHRDVVGVALRDVRATPIGRPRRSRPGHSSGNPTSKRTRYSAKTTHSRNGSAIRTNRQQIRRTEHMEPSLSGFSG